MNRGMKNNITMIYLKECQLSANIVIKQNTGNNCVGFNMHFEMAKDYCFSPKIKQLASTVIQVSLFYYIYK